MKPEEKNTILFFFLLEADVQTSCQKKLWPFEMCRWLWLSSVQANAWHLLEIWTGLAFTRARINMALESNSEEGAVWVLTLTFTVWGTFMDYILQTVQGYKDTAGNVTCPWGTISLGACDQLEPEAALHSLKRPPCLTFNNRGFTDV